MNLPVCDWCGHHHELQALCSERPAARGVSRRSFIALFSAGIVGAVVAPQLGAEGYGFRFDPRPLYPAPLDVKAFEVLVNGIWLNKVHPGEPVRGVAVPGLPAVWRRISVPVILRDDE